MSYSDDDYKERSVADGTIAALRAALDRAEAEKVRLSAAKTAALKIADERSIENIALRAELAALQSHRRESK